MTTQTIADAIAQAQAAAAAIPASQVPAVQQAAGTAVGAVASATPGAPLGLDDMLSGGVAVDHWFKLSEHGLVIGDKTKPLDSLEVYLDLSEIAYIYQIKYNLNGNAVYHKSYDRQVDAQGGSWMGTLQKAQAIDPKAYEYRSAEIPVTLAANITAKEGVVAAGERVGLTLATTAWKNFELFLKALMKQGIDAKSATLKLTLGHEVKTKAGVKPWAVPTYSAYEEVDVVPMFDTVH